MNNKTITKVFHLIELDALKKRNDAAHRNERNDGGSSDLLTKLKFFRAGMRQIFPAEWEKYHKAALREEIKELQTKDPEWKEFERLKKKFKP